MNFAQLLAMLRGASTPEARQTIFNGFTSDQRREAVDLLNTRVQELNAKQDRSDEETAEFKLCAEAGVELGKRVKEELDLANAAAQLNSIATTPDGRLNGMFNRHAGQRGNSDSAPNPTADRAKKVGTTTVDLLGRMIDSEGFGIPEATFNAISEPSYERAYLRHLVGKSDSHDLKVLNEANQGAVRSNMASGVDDLGGYLVPPMILQEIINRPPYPSGLLDSVRTILSNSDKVYAIKNIYNGSDIYNSPYRKTPTSGVSGSTKQEPLPFGAIEIPIHESMIDVPVPRAMLEDSMFNIREIVIECMRDAYRLGTEHQIAFGTGVGEPEGLLTFSGSSGKIAEFNVGSSPDAKKWMQLYREVPPMFRNGARLVISDDAYQVVESTQTTSGEFPFAVLNLNNSGLTNGPVEVYRGKPIVFSPFYQEYSSTNKVATWGDHRQGYIYALRLGVTMGVRDLADESYVKLVMRIRDGGMIANEKALVVAKAS